MIRLSNAEREKKYRERKKAKEGENYWKKEAQRAKNIKCPLQNLEKKRYRKNAKE